MNFLRAIETMAAVMVLAFLIIAAAAWVTTAICEALDRRKMKRQQEHKQDYTVWTDVQVLRR